MRKILLLGVFFVFIIFMFNAMAHVPYLERRDFNEKRPYIVRKFVEQSIAVYSWIEDDGKDIDVYKLDLKRNKARMYVEVIVPAVDEYYFEFVPWFALVGPNLPNPGVELPFEIPEGYGAIVKENVEPGSEREKFYEPFGGKSYYKGPILDIDVETPGEYYAYFWDPYETGGDYVAVIGRVEFFGLTDILRALIITPMIRQNMELHIP